MHCDLPIMHDQLAWIFILVQLNWVLSGVHFQYTKFVLGGLENKLKQGYLQ